MPIFLAALGGMFLNIAGSLVLRVITSLGVGVIAYKGISMSLEWLKQQAITSISGLPSEVIGLLSLLKVGNCISIIFSAILVRLMINGMSSDTVKSWVTK